jgi:hemoglobin-like flavoprotein
MRQAQIDIIRSTHSLIADQPDAVATLFYANLFALDPSLRAMFPSDMVEQGKKLTSALTLVVAKLHEPHALLPALHSLGQRHVAYGVRDEHYDTVGAALLRTLEQGLGNYFTEEAREAWAVAYQRIASHMIEGAELAARNESEVARA